MNIIQHGEQPKLYGLPGDEPLKLSNAKKKIYTRQLRGRYGMFLCHECHLRVRGKLRNAIGIDNYFVVCDICKTKLTNPFKIKGGKQHDYVDEMTVKQIDAIKALEV